MHIRWLPAAGGARTCQRRMCADWFNPGNSTRGPAARGKERIHRCVFPNRSARCLCQRLQGLPPSPVAGRQWPGGRGPPPDSRGCHSCSRRCRESGRWGLASSADTATRCPLQARARGQVPGPRRAGLWPPPSKEPEMGQENPQPWPPSHGAGRAHEPTVHPPGQHRRDTRPPGGPGPREEPAVSR